METKISTNKKKQEFKFKFKCFFICVTSCNEKYTYQHTYNILQKECDAAQIKKNINRRAIRSHREKREMTVRGRRSQSLLPGSIAFNLTQ